MFASGIFAFSCPVRIPEKSGGAQQTVARISLAARAPRAASGPAGMRAILADFLPDIHSDVFPELLDRLRRTLDAEQTRVVMRFPYFLEKRAPVTRTPSLMEYACAFSAVSGESGEPALTVRAPLTTLCPCSKEISEAGAHNQRALVTLTVRPRALIWLEDLIELVESCASCGVYALLKRPDEKFVTEWAYGHPMFVEDVARKVAQKAAAHPDVARFAVSVESFESIHSHNAFALVTDRELAAE